MRQKADALYKCGRGGFRRGEHAEPLLLLGQEDVPETVQRGCGDAEAGTEFFCCVQMKEVFCQHPQDEKKAVYRVWDDDIGKDGVGMPAACTA